MRHTPVKEVFFVPLPTEEPLTVPSEWEEEKEKETV